MPSPTPADKVLVAARSFARDKFAGHRYAMVLHSDQKHPHVHLIVKAENELGKRLHIDKALLQEWREHFAQLMRKQGIAANATRRAVRGKNKRTDTDKMLRAERHGRPRVLRQHVESVVKGYYVGAGFQDPAREKLVETRKNVVIHSGWIQPIFWILKEKFLSPAMSVSSRIICRKYLQTGSDSL
jgi:hypothetical protein